ncbi:DUF447 domain-containing protein [Azospirillum sp. SYSU D00513]|uniref:DUF447 domain-containing protein n=1 Tax=Azospirillum sp. SYSU D00513 TaxID=2812561 RepID=UPI001A97393B|nr:DUF447 domain-containing protein [Azospirillum sp. SYSU D00513]
MPLIRETVITTRGPDGRPHIAPMGVTVEGDRYILAPFRPSRTLDNMLATRCAVVNYTDEVRVIAGCVSGRKRDWPLRDARHVTAPILDGTLSHEEIEVVEVEEDEIRPRLVCRVIHGENHRPFLGLNRAQAAVVEAAVLISRLHMLPAEKIDAEIAYLTIAITKTAGPAEQEAWDWLMERIAAWREANP